MNKKVDPNTKHYFQMSSEQDLAEVLLDKFNKKKELKLTLWIKGEDEKEAEVYTLFGFDSKTKTLKMHPTGKLLSTIAGSPKTGKPILLKIAVDSKTNYFSGGILLFHKEDLSYSVQIQQEIFISQQRSNFRLNASHVIQIQFKINNNVYDALDLSTGGTCFKIPKASAEHYRKGQIFHDCTLRFDRKNYHIPTALISSFMPILDEEGKETGQIKVGIAFKDLPQKIVEELNVKIAVEARGDEMKKKFDAIFAKPQS